MFFLNFLLNLILLFSTVNRRYKVIDIQIDGDVFVYDGLSAVGASCIYIELSEAVRADCVMVVADDVGLAGFEVVLL